MRGTDRFWATVTIAGLLVGLGAITSGLLLVVSGFVLVLWLLVHQFTYVERLGTLLRIQPELEHEQERIVVDEPTTVQMNARLEASTPFGITLTPRFPPSVEYELVEGSTAIEPGETETAATFEMTSAVAGASNVGPTTVTVRDPGHLFVSTFQSGTPRTIDVEPRVPGHIHVGEGGKTLMTLYGEHKTNVGGSGVEPYEIRKYAPGDQLSRIDWRATARLDYPHVRENEITETYETMLVVDHRASMGTGPEGETKLDYLREVALAFVDAISSFDDPLGLHTVGDEGTTNARDVTAGIEQYDTVRRIIRELNITTEMSSNLDSISPTDARSNADRLDRDRSPMGATLRPYFEATDTYVRQLRNRPLFRTTQLARSRLGSDSWTVIVTDDTRRTEVREATKLSRQNDGQVLVFLAPSVLYEPEEADDTGRAYERYREFEEFRRSLARLDRVSAFEVAPGDRLDTILGRHRDAGRRGSVRERVRRTRKKRSEPETDDRLIDYPESIEERGNR